MWPDSSETQDLLAAARDGNADARNRLLQRHRDALRRICRGLGWGMSLHRTDASAAEVLLALRVRLSTPEFGETRSA